MRTLTPLGRGMSRQGFTLIELIIALLIFAMIGGTIIKALTTGQRAYNAQVQQVDLQQNVRIASGILPNELRELNASDGDIQTMDSVSMRIRSLRQMGIVCTLPTLGGVAVGGVLSGVTFAVRDTLQAMRYFTQGDSVLIYYEGDPKIRSDDGWVVASLTTDPGSGALTACTDGTGKQGLLFTASIRFDSTAAPPQMNQIGVIPLGSVIRAYQSVTYKRLKLGPDWYVGFDSAGVASTDQPLLGPLADSLGLKFSYYDSLDNKLLAPYTPAVRQQVARISIALALKTVASVQRKLGSPAPDTSRVMLEVALRNNRRF